MNENSWIDLKHVVLEEDWGLPEIEGAGGTISSYRGI